MDATTQISGYDTKILIDVGFTSHMPSWLKPWVQKYVQTYVTITNKTPFGDKVVDYRILQAGDSFVIAQQDENPL